MCSASEFSFPKLEITLSYNNFMITIFDIDQIQHIFLIGQFKYGAGVDLVANWYRIGRRVWAF